jgi:hypothetical protein
MNILVTGGAGFIGSAVCRLLCDNPDHHVVNVDKLTYAGNLESLRQIENRPNYSFVKADICEASTIADLLRRHEIDVIMHLAAESHVDRSIDGPSDQRRRHVPPAHGGTGVLARPVGRQARGVSLPPCLDRRGLWRPALRCGRLHRGHALRAVLALFGLEGRFGSPGPGLALDLRPAGRPLQLLQQLRSVPFSREADPARHPERAAREADHRLRHGRERPRLALCRRPRARSGAGRHERRSGPELQCRRRLGAQQPHGGRDDLRPARPDEAAAGRR